MTTKLVIRYSSPVKILLENSTVLLKDHLGSYKCIQTVLFVYKMALRLRESISDAAFPTLLSTVWGAHAVEPVVAYKITLCVKFPIPSIYLALYFSSILHSIAPVYDIYDWSRLVQWPNQHRIRVQILTV